MSNRVRTEILRNSTGFNRRNSSCPIYHRFTKLHRNFRSIIISRFVLVLGTSARNFVYGLMWKSCISHTPRVVGILGSSPTGSEMFAIVIVAIFLMFGTFELGGKGERGQDQATVSSKTGSYLKSDVHCGNNRFRLDSVSGMAAWFAWTGYGDCLGNWQV